MKTYTPETANFSRSIEIVERSDPADAELINKSVKQLLENDIILMEKGGTLASEEAVRKIAEDCLNGSGISGGTTIILPDGDARLATDSEVDQVKDEIGKVLDGEDTGNERGDTAQDGDNPVADEV